jgi:hypothetical protein
LAWVERVALVVALAMQQAPAGLLEPQAEQPYLHQLELLSSIME